MIEKYFEPWCVAEGETPTVALFDYSDSMTKIASSLDAVPAIQNYINTAKPEKGWYYLLIHAVGQQEVWGSNKNGDAFPEDQLAPHEKTADYGYRTFVTNANGYVHHRNKPPFWTGQVLLAEFSKPMGRVELIVRYSIKRLREMGAPYFVDMLEQGLLPTTSMGCRVPFDVCSICGNKAKNRLEYCDHLLYQKNTIMPDGRKVAMINIRPRFHDISLVRKPADPASRVLLKIAEEVDEHGVDKEAVIDKRIPAFAAGGIRRVGRDEYLASVATKADPSITIQKLLQIAKMDKAAAYTTLTAAGILLRPNEFYALENIYLGNLAKAAHALEHDFVCPVYEYSGRPYWYMTKVAARLVSDIVPSRSVYVPAVQSRIKESDIQKVASSEVFSEELAAWAQAYSSYRATAEDYLLSGEAVKLASHELDILKSALGGDIPITVGFQRLDHPTSVFRAFVRGGYLPVSTTVV